MSRALRFSLIVAALLLVSLTPKFLAGNTVLLPDISALQSQMAGRLRAGGLVRLPAVSPRAAAIRAGRGACRMMALNMEPEGHLTTWFSDRAATIGPATYHYRGVPSREFPRFWPPIEAFVQQAGFRLGLNIPRAPVIAVAATPACRAYPIDWSGLQLRGRRLPAA